VSKSNVWSFFTQQFYVETDGLRLITVVIRRCHNFAPFLRLKTGSISEMAILRQQFIKECSRPALQIVSH
jgi:hypothetical protein